MAWSPVPGPGAPAGDASGCSAPALRWFERRTYHHARSGRGVPSRRARMQTSDRRDRPSPGNAYALDAATTGRWSLLPSRTPSFAFSSAAPNSEPIPKSPTPTSRFSRPIPAPEHPSSPKSTPTESVKVVVKQNRQASPEATHGHTAVIMDNVPRRSNPRPARTPSHTCPTRTRTPCAWTVAESR
jgi:hypothetical protein